MSIIKILDENISSRIAAGEVVERPASIVKELVENSIDAGATSISVSILNGGIESICISDNGTGISGDDMPLTIVKHATSKIYSLKDLECIYTMGFRGEALSSIASVSMLTIKSKTKAEDSGHVLTSLGGKNISITEIGLPEGTTVLVEKLFFNTPARLKFLKKPSAEAAQISSVVASLIIAHPEISFKYTSNNNLIYHSPGDSDLLNAILCVEGLSIKDNLYRVDYKLYDIHVCGYIGSPDITYKRNSSKVYINTRIIKSDIVSNAVLKAYGERLLKGSLPFYVLNIKMDPKDVDVNVHPNKLSVHFKDDSLIYNAINCAVYESLNNNILSPVFDIEYVTKSDVVNTVSEPLLYDSVSDNLSKINCDNNKRLDTDDIKKYIADVMDISTSYMNAGTLSFNQTRSNFNNFSIKTDENSVKEFEQPVIINEIPDYIVIGTVFEGYIIVEVNETIYIIDQHALHERFIYDSIRKDMGAGVPIQQFLVSDAVKLSHVEYEAIENNLDLLKKSGFDLEVFGELTIKINAVPVYVEFVNSSVLLHDIADELLIGNKNFTNEILSEKIAKAACKRAVKSTWKLPPDAIDGLVKEIIDGDTIPCCPHGRPVAIAFTKKQLEKSFKRRL